MPRKLPKKSQVPIQRVPGRLLDSKLLKKSSDQITKTIAVAVVLGLVVGGGLLGYFIYSDTVIEPQIDEREIIVPESARGEPDVSPAPAGGQSASTPTSTLEQEPLPDLSLQQVEILATPTGFLNVRSGPGTNFSKVTQINPGEIYELLSADEAKGWYEIKLSGGTGWVTKQYARIK